MLLETLFLLISIFLATLGSFTFWPVNGWIDIYRPLVLFIATYLGCMVLTWTIYEISTLYVKKDKVYDKPSRLSRFVFNTSLSYIKLHALIKLKIKGLNNVPKNERFLLVCNHRSNFDSMIISVVLRKQYLAFISKPSLFKIPIGGKHMRKLCYLSINRDDNLQSLQVMKKAEEYIENDSTSIGVFPEGTRQQDKVIGDFHEGVFNIAIKTKCPVVICSIKGTDNVHANFPLKRTPCELNFVETLRYEDYAELNAKQLSELARNKIIQSLC